jgi:hypothetical protein
MLKLKRKNNIQQYNESNYPKIEKYKLMDRNRIEKYKSLFTNINQIERELEAIRECLVQFLLTRLDIPIFF